jgi:hypothetical protein
MSSTLLRLFWLPEASPERDSPDNQRVPVISIKFCKYYMGDSLGNQKRNNE